MTAKQLLKTLQFSSPRVIYIVNNDNKLQILRCPFNVRVIEPIEKFKLGQELIVSRIWNTEKLDTVFEINRRFYRHIYFDFIL